jgi:hypothetical protein
MSTNNHEYARLATPPDKSSLSEVGIASRQREYKRFTADLRAALKAGGEE